MSEAMQAYTKARAGLILDQPFFGTLSLRLTPIENPDVSTACTDGKVIMFNPKWFLKLSSIQRIGLIAHEVMHVALLHMLRRQERDPKRWNIAADYVINPALKQCGMVLPHGELDDPQYHGMETEQVYNLLPEDIGQDPINGVLLIDGSDPGGCGEVIDHESVSDGKGSGKFEAEIQIAIQQAAEVAKRAGKLPGQMQELIEKVLAPKIDWAMVLARFLRANNKSDFTWIKPNRRFIAQGMYLPSLHNPCLSEIAIITDTSGSTDEYKEQFVSETCHVLHDLNPERIHFIQCDYEVQDYQQYTREDLPLKITHKGGGGTAFEPAFEYIKQHCPQITAAVYLTDLESDDFGPEPPYPVLWVSTNLEEAPYGEIVKM